LSASILTAVFASASLDLFVGYRSAGCNTVAA